MKTTAKVFVIICAAITVIGRFITNKYYETMQPDARNIINAVCIASAVVLVIFAAVWIFCEKKSTAQNTDTLTAKKNDAFESQESEHPYN